MRSYLAFIIALAVGLCFLGAVASTCLATTHGAQAVVQQYVVPQQVIVPYVVQQQQAACVVQQFQAYSAPLVQKQIVQQKVVQQQFVKQRSFQRSRGGSFSSIQRQQINTGGRQRSLSIQSSSSGGGFLRNILPF